MSEASLSQGRIKELYDYSVVTGLFTRKTSNRNWKAGSIAGSHCAAGVYLYVDGNKYKASRLAWLLVTGKLPEGVIDHINGDNHFNGWINLRDVAHRENMRNCKLSKNNTSKVNGVCFDKSIGRWRSNIMVDRKKYFLGIFDDWFEAVCTRKSAEYKYGFHRNHGR